jgi:hypothetical protein
MANFNSNTKQIVILWSYEDFKQRAEQLEFDLTEQQIIEVMETVCNYYDPNYGVDWEIIDNALWEKVR